MWTHGLVIVPMFGAVYERRSWPTAGAAGDQDAWLTQALDYLGVVFNAILAEERKRAANHMDGDRDDGESA